MITKLSMRPNDTSKGRSVKLSHYIDLFQKHYGSMPDDLHYYIRRLQDIPFTMKDEILKILEEAGWEDGKIAIPDPTLLSRLVRRRE